jgi:uncharacterized protein
VKIGKFLEGFMSGYQFEWLDSLLNIPQADWDRLVGHRSPFLEWTWLASLEKAGCVSAREGWQPCHLLVRKGRQLVAAAPLYLKSHSRGEFVFDQAWAELAEYQLGIRYYPKLIGAIPFTPAVGYEFLIAEDEDPNTLTPLMVEAIDQFSRKTRCSCTSFLFTEEKFRQRLEALDFIPRIDFNYQWSNANYQDFEDFLSVFNANQRKNIRRERREMKDIGLNIQCFTGNSIPDGYYRRMYDFYSDTCRKFSNWSKYLNRKFFDLLDESFRHRTVFFAALHGPEPIGMSFCVFKGEQMYGRIWGAYEDIKFLHFNLCYYETIDWAIAHGIKRLDPGTGGQHKHKRGFPATPTYSLHRIYPANLKDIIENHLLERANPYYLEQLVLLNETLPMKGRTNS